TRNIAPTLIFGLRLPRQSWPAFDTTSSDVWLAPAIALERGDTIRLRAAALRLDSIASLRAAAAMPDSGWYIVAADAYLALGDSASALRSIRNMWNTLVPNTPLNFISHYWAGMLWPRAMLLRADLAAALGS